MKTVQRNILLNPGPATTTDTVKLAMVVPDICPRELEFGELTLSVRDDLIKIAKGEDTHTCVLLTSSGTGGVEACLTSVISPNKKVLIINNGAYGERMQQICDAYSIEHIDYNIQPGLPVDLTVLESLIVENLSSLTHLAFIHHETTVGLLNPIQKIGVLAHKYKLLTIVDAMSSFAGMDIDVKRDHADFLISSSNKCIQGMAGISFVIANTQELLKTKDIKRNFYFNLLANYEYLNRNKQFLFTPPVQTLYALRQAINEYLAEGAENRFKRYDDMYLLMKKHLMELGFKFFVAEAHHARLLTSIIEPKDPKYSFNDMHDYLIAKGFTIYPGKVGGAQTFRLSNIGAIDTNDISRFLEAFKCYLAERNIVIGD
jgi:2-aminoethylphosphonate aminotransferase